MATREQWERRERESIEEERWYAVEMLRQAEDDLSDQGVEVREYLPEGTELTEDIASNLKQAMLGTDLYDILHAFEAVSGYEHAALQPGARALLRERETAKKAEREAKATAGK